MPFLPQFRNDRRDAQYGPKPWKKKFSSAWTPKGLYHHGSAFKVFVWVASEEVNNHYLSMNLLIEEGKNFAKHLGGISTRMNLTSPNSSRASRYKYLDPLSRSLGETREEPFYYAHVSAKKHQRR